MSDLFPTETTAERPSDSAAVFPIIAIPSAPLWVMIATCPGRIPPGPNVASSDAFAE